VVLGFVRIPPHSITDSAGARSPFRRRSITWPETRGARRELKLVWAQMKKGDLLKQAWGEAPRAEDLAR
jgi:hypothetical protein